MNTLFLDALAGRPCPRPPIWLMRQAGRYMPEYRAIRQRHSFLEMCHQPELAAEITQMPIRRYGFDAAILFSDILVVAEALGGKLRFEEGAGPIFDCPLSSAQDVDNLVQPDVSEKLGFVSQAIRLLTSELKVPLIGFAGAPFTVASYLIEGKTSRDLKKTKRWMLQEPESFHRLLEKIARCTIDYLNMQVEAGVAAVQLFDSWANALSYEQFQAFSAHYLKMIMDGLKQHTIPVILFCRGTAGYLSALSQLQPAAISVDWACDIGEVRGAVPSSIGLQGNLDPHLLFGPKEQIVQAAQEIIGKMKGNSRYIFNLGHGILPETPLDAVQALVETVQSSC